MTLCWAVHGHGCVCSWTRVILKLSCVCHGNCDLACSYTTCTYFVLDANGVGVIWCKVCSEGVPVWSSERLCMYKVLSCFLAVSHVWSVLSVLCGAHYPGSESLYVNMLPVHVPTWGWGLVCSPMWHWAFMGGQNEAVEAEQLLELVF